MNFYYPLTLEILINKVFKIKLFYKKLKVQSNNNKINLFKNLSCHN